jgi:hypothetical protein
VLLHQGTVTVASPDPFGDMNTLTSSAPLKVHLTGWAADPSAPTQSLKVRIFRGPVGTTLLGEHTANVRRTDVGRAYPGYGELHGWDVTLDVPSGQQQICVQALNVGVGTNVALECGMVTVAPDTTPPITSITSASPGTVPLGTVVAYGFSANEPATFECSWDGAPMSPCASPSTADLPVGAHDFHVRATDASGNVETTPVGRGFEILPPGVVKISAALKAVKKRSRLRVDLGPDSSALNYRFVVQRKVNGKWYPVNDQPADKAFYDVAITVPDPLVGVSNGTLTERTTKNGRTTTKFHNTDPMASYLVTLGIGDYTHETDETASGTPLNYWVLPEQHDRLARLRVTKQALEWVETKLGDYPFDSAGVLLTESTSGMETQTLITLGDTDYATSPPVLVHELVHQWYGNLVGPTDWRDLWMNEGMAMYLQAVFEAKHGGPSLRATIEGWRANDSFLRGDEGPPGAYDPHAFGGSIVYTSPAVMWADLREQIGDDAFWELVRAWPEVAPDTATREEYLAWIEATTGEELTAFFDRWLTGESTPG